MLVWAQGEGVSSLGRKVGSQNHLANQAHKEERHSPGVGGSAGYVMQIGGRAGGRIGLPSEGGGFRLLGFSRRRAKSYLHQSSHQASARGGIPSWP